MSFSSNISLSQDSSDVTGVAYYEQKVKKYIENKIVVDKSFKKEILKQVDKLIQIVSREDIIEKYGVFIKTQNAFSALAKEHTKDIESLFSFLEQSEGTEGTTKYGEYSKLVEGIKVKYQQLLDRKSQMGTEYNDVSSAITTKQLLTVYKDLDELEEALTKLSLKLKKTGVMKSVQNTDEVQWMVEDKKTKKIVYSNTEVLVDFEDKKNPNALLKKTPVDEESAKALIVCTLHAMQIVKKDIVKIYAKSDKELSDTMKKLFSDYLKLIPETIAIHKQHVDKATREFNEVTRKREETIAILKSRGREADIPKLFGIPLENITIGNPSTTQKVNSSTLTLSVPKNSNSTTKNNSSAPNTFVIQNNNLPTSNPCVSQNSNSQLTNPVTPQNKVQSTSGPFMSQNNNNSSPSRTASILITQTSSNVFKPQQNNPFDPLAMQSTNTQAVHTGYSSNKK